LSTRKLIALALACGLAILIAGSIQLLRIKDNDTSTLAEGDSTELATVTAAVLDSSAGDGGTIVRVRLAVAAGAAAGLDDASAGWSALVSGETSPVQPAANGSCAVPVAPGGSVDCELEFAVQADRQAATVVTYTFAGRHATWTLT
jgi:hypothetical protein